ncbi:MULTISPECIES: hypothetical protein [Leeuwenhoekiella]|uniref:Four helix bundle protein n=1 Tax=Leeuwenhoekiella palythoae TaxID=573501 RepID=A0A1M5YWQ9_9FLAO|nr:MULTISPECIES: hypothetical protein [Leeuwenhoekiella]MAS20121.1 hypothetical protein [Leeuwenhoekiella sp.]MEC7782517.1 hypothetical protein [Bacteroidota bacterium]MBH12951.1 hypothetical protein [Leeuwenhoekiella sp.]MEC8682278.1 hypothetical protein [Bacteroidota bacterium]MEC8884142.1 hypothetical protein [Bacteroidota bacterium]|tara:strand:- start:460 stop:843 length:384 start_codon:yes stop_codon:yes gene_type:complete
MTYIPRNTHLYNQAIEILRLSRSVSNYLVYDLAHLKKDGSEDPYVYFTGDIVRQSDSLAPEILKAENMAFQDDRLKQAASIERLTSSLYRTCERLERAESNGKDFVRILRREIRKFRKLQHKWMMTL